MRAMQRLMLGLMMLFVLAQAQAQNKSYEFTLEGADGQVVTQKDFADQFLLVVFGFTFCPDVCPTTLFELKDVMATLEQPERLQPLFITIDPIRDDAQRLNQYVQFFDKRIIGLTGSLEAIDAVVKQFNASYGYRYEGKKVTPPDLPEGYIVYHSTYIYLLAPKTRDLVDVFDYQTGSELLTQRIAQAMQAYETNH
ncbi:SCO family protein [Rappaport israeli]|uniref:SCO family protein n=1 Tax=Rappaport israeli TaxID=1839807 RepID=UPI00093000BA|nr:SCO family protein [Rappaport israeli]